MDSAWCLSKQTGSHMRERETRFQAGTSSKAQKVVLHVWYHPVAFSRLGKH